MATGKSRKVKVTALRHLVDGELSYRPGDVIRHGTIYNHRDEYQDNGSVTIEYLPDEKPTEMVQELIDEYGGIVPPKSIAKAAAKAVAPPKPKYKRRRKVEE